ncbi:BRCA1-associated RING domain protein 1-like isoform X2 [Sipha flava]|uniref:BRCA1-associated RING domain protein 1-like isoform X2 n=1 Tax=Sipha flava TaxID=143950 RepID=A0A8B8GPA3_9HEMI|nr:BRCA1-associated RING domain protein 1-like isoform X2 [Sipha flava]
MTMMNHHKHTMNIPFLENELKDNCCDANNPIDYESYEMSIYIKNILVWLDPKMKYIPEGPERSLTLGHTRNVPDEKILRLHLTFPQQNEEEQNTLVSTQNNLQIVSNNNENLAIAGPSRNNFSNNPTRQADKNIYARNNKGETKMHTACAKGDLNLVTSLLVEGFNPNVKDNAGWTPMHEAVKNGEMEIVKILIKYGALLNVPGFEYESPLHMAIRYKHFDIAVILLQHGADAKHINIFGNDAQSLDPKAWSELFRNTNIELRSPSSLIHLYDYKSDQIIVFPMKLTIKNSIIKNFSKKFNIKIVENILNSNVKLSQVTHIVVPNKKSNVCDVNLECLIGIANGLFIVNENWISDSLNKNQLLYCIPYEINGTTMYPNVKSSCISRIHKQKLHPKLFDGINIHISGNIGWKQFTRDNIKQLVLEFGAKLLNRFPNPEDCPINIIPYYCRNSEQMRNVSTIVLYTEDSHRLIKYNMNHLKVFPISWFMEVILKYSIVDNIYFDE